jgi:hypothetical protein
MRIKRSDVILQATRNREMKSEIVAEEGPSFICRKAVSALMLLLAITMLTSCGKKKTEKEVKRPSHLSKAQEKPEIQVPDRSVFLEQVDKHEFPEAEAPAEAVPFRWDFSGDEVHAYAYSHQVKMRGLIGFAHAATVDSDSEAHAKGRWLIKGKGDATADIVMTDLKMTIKPNPDLGDEQDTTQMTIPTMVVQGLQEDGSLSTRPTSQEMLMKLLFPLPPDPLNVGESVDVPMKMPFNAMGSLLEVRGRSRITLSKYVKVADRTCARFETDIDISQLDLPEEVEGEYECFIRGLSVFYFDPGERCFVAGDMALLMVMSSDTPAPRFEEDEDASEMPDKMRTFMVSDNLIQFSLEK